MSGGDEEMDWATSPCGGPSPTTPAEPCAETKDEVQVTVSVKWSESPPTQKCDHKLEKALQAWFNKRKSDMNLDVLDVQDNGMVKIKIKPAPALSDLQELCGQTLTLKDKKTVTILEVILSPPELETQITEYTSEPQNGAGKLLEQPDDMTTDIPPQPETQSAEDPPNTAPTSSGSKSQDEQPVEQSSTNGPAAGEETNTGILPVIQFMYMNNVYKKEIENIMKKNQVEMRADAHVTFKAVEETGTPSDALCQFTNLVQKVDYVASLFTLKNRNPKELMDALQIVRTKESKLMLTLSSEEMVTCGPSQSQDAIKKSLKTTEDTNPSAEESMAAPQDTSPNIDINIIDPFLSSGLIFEEKQWKLMKTFSDQKLTDIEDKFGVDIKSDIGQGEVNIKTCYKGLGGNASMESHALRALLRLYQKTTASSFNSTQPDGTAGFKGSLKSGDADELEGASGGPEMNGKSAYNIHYPDAPKGEGATTGDNQEEKCPICMDAFTKKTQLKCKHEFCKECLESSKESMGPVCPVCRYVFGKVEGDQPPGMMRWSSYAGALPGFPYCGHIIITYSIPGGRQTKKHPNPGKYYSGIERTAYLPDNEEGREVVRLLKKAFDQKLIFTVGTSRTTGAENQVTWNDIHHKTSMTGGTTGFGYPDPDYLSRVKEELKAKGVE